MGEFVLHFEAYISKLLSDTNMSIVINEYLGFSVHFSMIEVPLWHWISWTMKSDKINWHDAETPSFKYA